MAFFVATHIMIVLTILFTKNCSLILLVLFVSTLKYFIIFMTVCTIFRYNIIRYYLVHFGIRIAIKFDIVYCNDSRSRLFCMFDIRYIIRHVIYRLLLFLQFSNYTYFRLMTKWNFEVVYNCHLITQ